MIALIRSASSLANQPAHRDTSSRLTIRSNTGVALAPVYLKRNRRLATPGENTPVPRCCLEGCDASACVLPTCLKSACWEVYCRVQLGGHILLHEVFQWSSNAVSRQSHQPAARRDVLIVARNAFTMKVLFACTSAASHPAMGHEDASS